MSMQENQIRNNIKSLAIKLNDEFTALSDHLNLTSPKESKLSSADLDFWEELEIYIASMSNN